MKDIISALWNLLLLFFRYLTPFKAMEKYVILTCLTYFISFAIGRKLLKLHFLFFVFFFLIYFFLLFPLGICRRSDIPPLPSQILPQQNKALNLSNQSENHFPFPFPVTCWFPVEQERRLCLFVFTRGLWLRPLAFCSSGMVYASTHGRWEEQGK